MTAAVLYFHHDCSFGIFYFLLDLNEWHCKRAVLALVDGQLWDMYKPLTHSCEIQFLTFKDEDPEEVNQVCLC